MKKFYILLLLTVSFSSVLLAQERTVSGTVQDTDGQPLPGVNILIKGSNVGTVTDFDGKFSLSVPGESTILLFSYVGFETQSVTVGSQSTFDINLATDITALSEVVVTAFGLEKEKKALGYSATELSNKEFVRARETNFVNSLSGKVAGVQITPAASGLGSSSKVVIRGNNSIGNNNQPLYVVDGIPIDNSSGLSGSDEWGNGVSGAAGGSSPLSIGGVDLGSGISDLNPDDIESVTVLKGPSASALYGARGANGVIMITTKKGGGRNGVSVSYSTNLTMEQAAVLPEFQNEYGTGNQGVLGPTYDEILTQSSWGPRLDGSTQPTWTGDGDTAPYTAQPDNFKDFFRNGYSWTNSFAVTSNGENGSVRLSYTDLQSQGIVPGNELDRKSVTLRGSGTMGKLTSDTKISYTNQNTQNRPTLSLWPDNPVLTLSQMGRNVRIEDLRNYQKEDGSSNTPLTGFFNNPYFVQKANHNEDTRNRVFGFTSLTYKFNDWLSIMGRAGTDFTSQKYVDIVPIGHTFRPNGTFGELQFITQETNLDFLLMFNKGLSEDINLSLNFGGNHRKNFSETIGFNGDTWIARNTFTVSNLANSTAVSNIGNQEVNSLYGFGQLSYQNMIFLDFTARNDWSSTLPSDNWSFFYPSVSTSVILSDLLDLNNGALSFLKVRGSWAQVGNDTSPYQLSPVYNFQGGVTYNGQPVASNDPNRKNPLLKPEITTSSEFGVDARFFNGRITLDATYYQSSTKDQILLTSTPLTSGFATVLRNAGEIQNNGVELALGATVVSNSNFSWQTDITFTRNNSEVIELYDDVTRFLLTQGGGGGKVQVVADVGEAYGEIIGFTYRRDPDTGDIVYGSTGLPERSEEMVSFGNINPDFLAGIANTFTYKNFTLYTLIDIKSGGEVVSVRDAVMNVAGTSVASLEGREGGFTVTGSTDNGTSLEPITVNDVNVQDYHRAVWNNGILDDFVYNAGFVKMREMSLSYAVPSAILGDSPFSAMNVSLVGRNLFFFKKHTENFDPETSFSTANGSGGIETFALPSTRSYGFNLSVTF